MSTDAPGGNSRCGYRLDWMISVDDHILEPASIWQDRLPAQYLEAGPQVVVKDGTDYWPYEGRLFPTSGLSAVAGKKYEDITPMPSDTRTCGWAATSRRHGCGTWTKPAWSRPSTFPASRVLRARPSWRETTPYSMIGIARAALGVKTGST
jgi:hypothetical protein